jgi:NADP-dependent 3-hydroxy acid dehydrogenase YdfG
VRVALAGRTAAVTGASRGIGLAIATTLAGDGVRVALLARNPDALASAATAVGSGALPVVCDVRDPGAVARAADAIAVAFGDVPHVLVCAAGLFPLQAVAETTPDEFADVIASNLLGPFLIARAMLPQMLTRGDGHLVLIGSSADRRILPENGAYSASKFGARALWEVLRAELRGTGVRATLVSPGPTDTAIWDPHDPGARRGFVPRSGMLSAESVADAVRYAVTRPAGVLVEELRLAPA